MILSEGSPLDEYMRGLAENAELENDNAGESDKMECPNASRRTPATPSPSIPFLALSQAIDAAEYVAGVGLRELQRVVVRSCKSSMSTTATSSIEIESPPLFLSLDTACLIAIPLVCTVAVSIYLPVWFCFPVTAVLLSSQFCMIFPWLIDFYCRAGSPKPIPPCLYCDLPSLQIYA